MKPSDIKIGRTYCNRGKGRTQRTVLEIRTDIQPPWYGKKARPGSPVVRYRQGDHVDVLYLFSFSSWAGRDVTEERGATK